jgi:hypothetical protein
MRAYVYRVVLGVHWRGMPSRNPNPARCDFIKDGPEPRRVLSEEPRMLVKKWICWKFASPQGYPSLGRKGEMECAPGEVSTWNGKNL